MGCDIHLSVETRRRKIPYPNAINIWRKAGFYDEFSSRIYGMFARMAKVREYGDDDDHYKVQFEPRGLPEDIVDCTSRKIFYMYITEDEELAQWGEGYCSKEDAEEWVEQGYSEWVNKDQGIITNPDYHSHSWLTTQELRQCYDDCFKFEDGTMKPHSNYVEWLGLVSLCEGVESTGEYECRVIFAFDN